VAGGLPLSTLLSRLLVAHTIELDNEFERRLAETGHSPRIVSLVMWSNFLRFVGDGITVLELPEATQLPKGRVLSRHSAGWSAGATSSSLLHRPGGPRT
jgi:hypothetical protein